MTDIAQTNDPYRCDNCGKTHDGEALKEIKDYWMRVELGSAEPSGECPDCGALCYPLKTGEANVRTFDEFQSVVIESYDNGKHCAHTQADIHKCGDTMLTFLLVELSEQEDCDSLDEAIRRIDSATRQLTEVRAAFEAKQLA